jgi:hypothetical protein
MKKALLAFAALSILLAATAAKNKKEDPYNEKKLRPTERSGIQKFLGTNRYDVLDEFSVFIKTMIGKLKVKKGTFIYRRGTDIAGFRVYYDTSAYAVQMAQEAREICIAAIDRYCADFENKALDRSLKAAKSRRLYGQTVSYMEYGVAMEMMNYKAKPITTFGYVFDDRNPYFVIHMDKAKNLTLEGKSSKYYGNLETIILNFYFTRKQALELKKFLSNDNVNSLKAKYDYKEFEIDAQNEGIEYSEADDTVPEKNKKQKKNKKTKPAEAEEYSEGDDYTEIKQ